LDPISIAIPLAIVLLSLTVHEAAHAWSADRLGDPTARLLGRVSLNPIVHIDVIGTIVLPLLAVFGGLPVIGWAKPVPVNTSRLRDPRRDFMMVAAAGPASNLLQAFGAAVLMRLLPLEGASAFGLDWMAVLRLVIVINVFLAVFNLVPVPPLDGGNVLAGLLPPRAADVFVQLRPYGFLIVLGLLYTGVLWDLIRPPSSFLMRLLLP
jgi:Zn-dependent protease